MMWKLAILSTCIVSGTGTAATLSADSARGERLFESLQCVQCHSINGKGGKIGPDLGRRIDRNFTPASLAATIWNHAPTMRAAMRERNIAAGDLTEGAAADLFAYFYSAHFFDKPGDAGRGKALFDSKHCSECHGIATAQLASAKAVSQWESIGQPLALAAVMWNHGANMRDEFANRKLKWPELTSQNFTDLLVYVRNRPELRNTVQRVEIVAGTEGESLFQSKGCIACHTGKLTLTQGRLRAKTLVDIAAAMWNHQPRMAPTPQPLSTSEMERIASYLWAAAFFEDSGDAIKGKRVFDAKRCSACHGDSSSGAPPLTGRPFNGARMVSSLWLHGPGMLEQMKTKGIEWPRFEGSQMANLIAFLNSDKGEKK
jgi:mono/diheme cytochrome c family protein